MKTLRTSIALFVATGFGLFLSLHGSQVYGQQNPAQPKATPDDDVIRVSTTLVQTDVMVFDKQGKFIEGLKPDQFQVKINGAPVDIAFLEMVVTGSDQEKAQIAAARGARPVTIMGEKGPSPITAVEGRSLFLFVDDFHLTAESLMRTRKMLTKTVDEMIVNDRAMIITASGQLGAQNLSSDKEALKATIARLAVKPGVRQSIEEPPMTETAAVAINRGDRSVMDYYVNQILKTDPTISREQSEEKVNGRADNIIEQAAPFATYTLTSLESFVRELANVPGRKLLFFVSDGFIIENQRSVSYPRLSGAIAEAARGGIVIYTLNARGLVTGSPGAEQGGSFQAELSRVVYSDDKSGQEVLYSLAEETGGRPVINNNDLNLGIRKALDETSKYYLISWRPSPALAESAKVKRIEVSVVGSPGLKVRTRKGIAEALSTALASSSISPIAPTTSTTGGELVAALVSNSTPHDIPASLVAAYRSDSSGRFALKASMQMSSEALTFADENGRKVANVDVAGFVRDQGGKEVASFNKRVNISADSNTIDAPRKLAFYNYDAVLVPGNYQLKWGVRDVKTGRIGSATQSLTIPDLGNGKLALSSLMLNEHTEADDDEDSSDQMGARKGVAQRFARASRMRFLTYVYNAARVAAEDNEPDLTVEAKISRGGQAVLSPALREIGIERGSDTKAYPYVAEIPLSGLEPGEYSLLLTVTDVTTKATATQQITFIVD